MLLKLRYLSICLHVYPCTAIKFAYMLTAKLHPGPSANLYWCNARKDGAVS